MGAQPTQPARMPDTGQTPVATAPNPPLFASGVPVARPIAPISPTGTTSEFPAPIPTMRSNRLAVASVAMGAVPLIPILSQIIGIVLGLMALRRISQARRAGVAPKGTRCAWAGIGLNIISLLGWILTLILGSFVASNIAGSLEALQGIRIPTG